MIGWLQGKIIDKTESGHLVLNVQGVGYDIDISLQTYVQLNLQSNETVSLYIHTVVREDAIILFGFWDKMERTLFRTLIKVNGIGPRVAMAILSSAPPAEIIQMIQMQDMARLTQVPGIGKKTAERLLVELKDVLKFFKDSEITLSLPGTADLVDSRSHALQEAVSALEALGYKPQEAYQTVHKIDDQQMSCEELIRQALKQLYTPRL